MDMTQAIMDAVSAQLRDDGKPAIVTGNEVMSTDFSYNITTIRAFLYGVSVKLAKDPPGLTFQWTTLDPNLCLTDAVSTLIGYIASATH